jgi:hypothetical protein
VVPWLIILTVVLGIVTYVPWISTWMPSLIKVDGEITNADRMANQQGSVVGTDDLGMEPMPDFEDFLGGDDFLLGDAGVTTDAAVTADGGAANAEPAATPEPAGGTAE